MSESDIIIPDDGARLSSIVAHGPMVRLNLSNGAHKLISRREALLRARAISVGFDADGPDLVEALLMAANQARINDPEYEAPYPSNSLELFLKAAAHNVNV